jgi:DNA-binding XRE family transcriptional regulator
MFPELPDPAPGYPAALPPPPGKLGELYGDNPERILGQRLRALREDAGMTQAQLAEAMTRWGFSLHQTTIGKIETNQRQVTVNEGVMLATLLGCPTCWPTRNRTPRRPGCGMSCAMRRRTGWR